MALGALVIIAVLVAGSSYLTQQESRLGQNSIIQARANAMAEYGLNKIQADWDLTPNLQMNNGASFDTSYTLAGQGTCAVRYTRLNNETFWIVAQGEATLADAPGRSRKAVKRLGSILRLRIPTIRAEGAATSNGAVKLGSAAQISGANNIPPGWTLCPAAPDKAGIVIPDSGATKNAAMDLKIDTKKIVGGTPKVLHSAVASDPNTYVAFGDETWSGLVASANHKFLNGSVPQNIRPEKTAGGACDKSLNTNWGEPMRAGGSNVKTSDLPLVPECENYFPIIYVSCTPPPDSPGHPACQITMSTGRGQGILFIHGDLHLVGNFEWTGLIVVSGDFTKGARVTGAVMAANTDLADDTENSNFMGNSFINYSACALDRALRGSAQVVPAKHRAWTELYNAPYPFPFPRFRVVEPKLIP